MYYIHTLLNRCFLKEGYTSTTSKGLIHSLLINFLELTYYQYTYLYCKKLVAKAFYQPEIGAFNTEKTY